MVNIRMLLLLIGFFNATGPVLVRNAVASETGAEARWDRRFAPPGAQGIVLAMAFDQNRIYLGGGMQSVGRVLVGAVAEGDGKHWRNLPNGPQNIPSFLSAPVMTLAVFKGDLYAGGNFVDAGQAAGALARWDGMRWSVLSGPNGVVYLLRTDGNSLYATGRFTVPGDTNEVNLARWDGRAWQVLSGEALCHGGTNCPYSVGPFEIVGEDIFALVNWRLGPAHYYFGLARLDKARNWTLFPGPGQTHRFSTEYSTLTTLQGELVLAGKFTSASNAALRNVALWRGGSWQPLGEGLAGYAKSIVGNEHRLIALHELTNGYRRYIVSEWRGRRWSTLGTNHFGLEENPLRVFIGPKHDVYVTGSFSGIRPVAAANVVRWNGARWEPLFEGDYEGLAGGIPAVLAFTEHQGEVYLGGSFITAGAVLSPGIARWDGKQMQDVGDGLNHEPLGLVQSLASSGDRLFAGGRFNSIGGVVATNIAVWNGTTWMPLGNGLPEAPTTLAWWRGSLYAAGFVQPFGVVTNILARWNGAEWTFSRLGSNASVNVLAVWRDEFYAGGSFTQAGAVSVSCLARWDGGQWHDPGGGVFSLGRASVTELAAGSDGLYVAGNFMRAGGIMATNIARWDGIHWQALGEGWRGPIMALAACGTTVFVGGRLTNDFGQVHLRQWDGQRWISLRSAIKDTRPENFERVSILVLLATKDELFAGGSFTTAGGKPSAGVARWIARPQLHFGKASEDPDQTGKIQFYGEPGLNWRWETSIDLQNWALLPEDANDEEAGKKFDTNSPARFFRGVLEP